MEYQIGGEGDGGGGLHFTEDGNYDVLPILRMIQWLSVRQMTTKTGGEEQDAATIGRELTASPAGDITLREITAAKADGTSESGETLF